MNLVRLQWPGSSLDPLAATKYVNPAAKAPIHLSLIVTSHWFMWHSSSSLCLSGAVTPHLRSKELLISHLLVSCRHYPAAGSSQTTKFEGAQQTSSQHIRSHWYGVPWTEIIQDLSREDQHRLLQPASPDSPNHVCLLFFTSPRIPLQSFKPTSNPCVDSRLLGMPER